MPTAKTKKPPSEAAAKANPLEPINLAGAKPEQVSLERLASYQSSMGPVLASNFRELSESHVEQLVCDLEQGVELPPIDVLRTETEGRERLIVIAGNHRLAAYQRLKKPPSTIAARVHENLDPLQAFVAAVADNRKHGRPMSGKEKRAAITELLNQPTTKRLSTRAIADFVGCSHQLVADLKNELAGKPTTKQKANQKAASADPEPATRKEEPSTKPTPQPSPKSTPPIGSKPAKADATKAGDYTPTADDAHDLLIADQYGEELSAVDWFLKAAVDALDALSERLSEAGEQNFSNRIFEVCQQLTKARTAYLNLSPVSELID